MAIATIQPSQLRQQSKEAKVSSFSGVNFSDVTSAVGGVGATAAGVATNNYQPAAVTQAAISGIASAPAAFGGASSAPYLGTSSLTTSTTPFASGGYQYGNATFSGGVNGYNVSTSLPGSNVPGMPGTPSQDFQEKQYLFQQMNDSNWQMLTAQVTVNELSKNYQASSNILKTKSDTELNAVRNMRA